MSLQFSATSSPYNGIIQRIEQEVYGDNGLARISGNTQLLGMWTTSVNLALTDAIRIILESDGRWQFDDSNHTDYPIIYTNIVSGQRDYSFTSDENSNLILDIEKVAILKGASETVYEEIDPWDIQDDEYSPFVANDSNVTGTPTIYDKLANAVILDPIPNYNATNGLKIYISREGSFFATSDTTKKPGIDARFHEYLVLRPALNYAMTNNLSNLGVLRERVTLLEDQMREVYSKRSKDEQVEIHPYITSFR